MDRLNAGTPVTGKDFIGREEEITKIAQLLSFGQSVVLIAPRRFGKTSLALEVLSRLKSKEVYTSYIDVFSTPDLRTLSTQITESVLKNHRLDKAFIKTRESALLMLKNLKLKATIEEFEFILGYSEKMFNEWLVLEQSIDFINQFALKHSKKMICAFDEFGDIEKLDGDRIVKLFRSKIQQHKHASYLFSGSYESIMQSMFVKKNAPFFRFARIINLGPIEKVEFKNYYNKILRKNQVIADNSYLDQVLDFTGGHPYYSQLALQEIIIMNLMNQKIPEISQLITSMINAEKNYLELSWEEISSSKELVATTLAIVKSGSDIYRALKHTGLNVYRALRTLKNNGTISMNNDKSYQLNDPLLNYWIKENVIR